ncbi:MAG: IS30 family transposase [Gemmatimonadota bacterium]
MYSQITAAERYTLGLLRQLGLSAADRARALYRHPSTIGGELAPNGPGDGSYRPALAQARPGTRHWRSRVGDRFTPAVFSLVTARLAEQWSPEQISAVLGGRGQLSISPEIIYRYIWADKRPGGELYTHLCGALKLCRKRYGGDARRGRVTSERPITERPAHIASRRQGGHWEVDTVLGTGDRCRAPTGADRGRPLVGGVAAAALRSRPPPVPDVRRGSWRPSRRRQSSIKHGP